MVLAKDAYVMAAPLRVQKVCWAAWAPACMDSAMSAVLFFQEPPRKLWDSPVLVTWCILQFTKPMYVKNQWKCLRRCSFGCISFVGF